MSRKTELAKNTAILTVGKLCTQCISFFLLPLYTAILSTEEYGTFDLLALMLIQQEIIISVRPYWLLRYSYLPCNVMGVIKH